MRKIYVLLCVLGLLSLGASPLFAGGIINKQNQSADYVRTLNRNAATDAADIVAYNPAGVMKLENGFYTKLDVMYFNKEYSNTVPGFDEFESDEPSIIPGFFAVYKQDRWAGFFAVTIPGGGGAVEYPNGDASTASLASSIITQYNRAGYGIIYTGINSMKLEADSMDVGYNMGGAFKINEMFSVAGGLRYIDAKQSFKGEAVLDRNPANPASRLFGTTYDVDVERTATGWGYFLGLNVTPIDKLNLGLFYISNTELDFESEVSEDTAIGTTTIARLLGWEDGSKQREDLPGELGLGASYIITPQLRVEVDYTLFLENSATFESDRLEGKTGNSWETGIAFEYTINPRWKTSVGYLRTDIVGLPTDNKLPEAPELDADTISAGVVFSPLERLKLTLGALKVWYDSEEMSSGVKLEKDVWAVALGVQYRFF